MEKFKVCINCGAKNPSTNKFCEDCGYNMDKAPASARIESLYCPNGHTVGDTSFGFCDVCGEKLVPVMPSSKKTKPESIVTPLSATVVLPTSPVHESHGKKCPSCGTMNPDDGLYCEECGASLIAGPAEHVPDTPAPVIHRVPVRELPETPPTVIDRAPVRELPETPAIMRTLTNDDMKR